MQISVHRRVLMLCLIFLCVTSPAWSSPVLVGQGSTPGTATDFSNPSGQLEDGTPANLLGGLGSGIAYSGTGNRFALVPDRGPANGTTTYKDRFEFLDITVNAVLGTVTPTLVDTRLMTNGVGGTFTGLSSAFNSTNSPNSLRFDPEGVRYGRSGSLFVSDEYGPFVYEFDQNGTRVRSLPVPTKYLISTECRRSAGIAPQ